MVSSVGLWSWLGGGYGPKEYNHQALDHEGQMIFAHRGVVQEHPENSLGAFEVSRGLGFDAIEIDLRKTKDDVLVVFHDATTERLLGVEGTTAQMTAAELKAHPLLHNGRATSYKVQTLKEFLEWAEKDFVLYFDMKVSDYYTLTRTVELIETHDLFARSVVANRNLEIIAFLEWLDPRVNTVWEDFEDGDEWMYNWVPVKFKPDHLASFCHVTDSEHFEWLKTNGHWNHRIVYGVDKGNFEFTRQLGIQHMILDYEPELIGEWMRSAK